MPGAGWEEFGDASAEQGVVSRPPQPDPVVVSPVGMFLAALGNPGQERAAGQEGTCAGVLWDGLAPAGQCCSSDLHRAVSHTALHLSKGVSHSDLGLVFFYSPRLQPNSGKR